MNDGAPSLEVGLEITTGGSFAALAQLAALADTTEAKVVRNFVEMERAAGGSMNLAAATTSVTTFGNAATRVEQDVRREKAATEAAIDRMVKKLDQQTAAVGRTREEQQMARIEELALAAARQDNGDAADRLLVSVRALGAAQTALAQDKLAAETRAAAAATREREQAEAALVTQLLERSRLQAALDRTNSTDRSPATQSGATYSALTTKFLEDEKRDAAAAASEVKRLSDEHARLVAQVRGSHDAQEADAVAAERLREATDAEYAATKRLNAQIAESTRLFHSGATAPAEYARQQQVLNGQLRGETGELDKASQAHGRHGLAAGLARNSQMELIHVLKASAEQMASGAPPLTILTTHLGQLGQIAATTEGGVWGMTKAVGGMAAPFAPLLPIIVGSGIALYRWNQELNKDADLKKYAAGLGLTKKEMKDLGDQSVTAGDMMAGLWKTISDGMGLGGSGKKILDYLVAPGDVKMVENFIAQIYGVFTGGYEAIVTMWHGITGSIAGSVGGASQAAAGFFKPIVAGAQWAWEAVSGLFTALYDKVSGWVKSLGGWVAPILKAVGMTDAAQSVAAAATKIGQAAGKGYTAGVKQATGGMDKFAGLIGTNAVSAAQERLKKKADEIKENRSATKPKKESDHGLDNALKELDAQIKGQQALAAAYQVSDAAAIKAEALQKAEQQAIRHKGETSIFYEKELALAVAQADVAGAKRIADLTAQTAAQREVNDAVAAGTIPASQMSAALQQVTERRQLLANIAVAEEKGWADQVVKLKGELASLGKVQAAANAEANRQQVLASTASGQDQLAKLRLEATLIGATNEQRAIAIAQLEAEQYLAAHPGASAEEAQRYVDTQKAIAKQTSDNATANDAYNASLTQTADHWDIIAGKVQTAGQGMADAFGSAGKAIGDVASTYASYMASQSRLQAEHDTAIAKAGKSEKLISQENQRFALQSSGTQIAAYGDMIGAAKGFFKEGTAGYDALAAAEKVYRVAQFAMSIQAMVQQVRETLTHVASSAARSTANAAEGVSAQAKLPFPFNLVAMAATAAALVAAGIAVIGGSGGGASSHVDLGNTGTGTVLGDSTKGSDSIKNSIDALGKVDLLTNTYSREMAASLKSIDSQIGGFAAEIVKGGDINASSNITTGFQTSGLGSILSKIPLIGGILGSLFGTRTDITGSGLIGGAQTIGQINASGYSAQSYSDVEKTKKFLGIVTGRSYSTQTAALDPSLNNQFTLILKSFDDAITAAAGPLGEATGAIQDRLDSFVVNIGKIDLQGLSGDDIEKKLQNIFGSLGDQMATYALPQIAKFQKVGEGALETLVRVASTVEAVTTALDELGTSSANLGIDAKMGLASQFDSLSDMSSAIDGYFTRYYSSAEQAAAKTAQMAKVFDSLGVSMPDSLAGFRQLVEAQDLTTAAGQSTYATLLQLAPAFADLQTTMDGAKSAADILSERMDLQKQLWQATGDTASIRANELAALDPSNRALQQRLYDLADEAALTDAANQVAQERKGLETTLLQLQGDTVTQRQNEIAALDPANRALQEQVFALQDQQAAAAAAAQADQAAAQAAAAIAQERSGIEQQLLNLQGDTVALRQRELAALDPTNRALQEQVFALTDLQAAQAAATQAEQEAAQAAAAVAQERTGLEGQLLQLQGDTVALRQRELAALDPTNRAIQEQIYALTDLQAAQEAATQAEQAAASAAMAIAQERAGIQSQLWQLQGDTTSIRAAELAALDPANRALQEQVYALQDQQAATAAAAQAAQEAAQSEQALAQERTQLMQQLWQLTGDTASIRAAQLAGLAPSNRALQEQIYAVSDAQDAAKAAATLADAWKSVGDSIMDEINRIRGLGDTGGDSFASLQGKFNAAIAAATGGDQDAAKSLPELSKSLLDAAGLAATSRQELSRIEAQTAGALQQVYDMIGSSVTASGTATSAMLGTTASNDNASNDAWWSTFANTASAASAGGGDASMAAAIDQLRAEVAGMRSDNNKGHATTAEGTTKTAGVLDRAQRKTGGDSLSVAQTSDAPVVVKVAA